jgi:hypothetical protein
MTTTTEKSKLTRTHSEVMQDTEMFVQRIQDQLTKMAIDSIKPLDKQDPLYERKLDVIMWMISRRWPEENGFTIELNEAYDKLRKIKTAFK